MNIDKNSIKRKLESKRCRVHGEHPSVAITPSGFSFKCCCEKFRLELISEANEAVGESVGEAAKKSIEDSLKKMFK